MQPVHFIKVRDDRLQFWTHIALDHPNRIIQLYGLVSKNAPKCLKKVFGTVSRINGKQPNKPRIHPIAITVFHKMRISVKNEARWMYSKSY